MGPKGGLIQSNFVSVKLHQKEGFKKEMSFLEFLPFTSFYLDLVWCCQKTSVTFEFHRISSSSPLVHNYVSIKICISNVADK